jgi:hypothetical protein
MKSVRSYCSWFGGGGRIVTEPEWLASHDPLEMLAILEPWVVDGDVSERQLRLFVCACSRRLWHLLTDERRKHIELAERFVDGKAPEEEITAGRQEIYRVGSGRELTDGEPAFACWCILEGSGYGGPDYYRMDILEALSAKFEAEEGVAQAALLRDIVGNPFSPVAFNSAWRTELSAGIASRMYEERDFAGMPILADALEEAGCDNADILAHCREPGAHVRGCWVVDHVLSKRVESEA